MDTELEAKISEGYIKDYGGHWIGKDGSYKITVGDTSIVFNRPEEVCVWRYNEWHYTHDYTLHGLMNNAVKMSSLSSYINASWFRKILFWILTKGFEL